LGSAVVAGLLLLLFLLDFVLDLVGVTGFLPFGGLDYFVDIVCVIGSGLLLYLALDSLRELR
jgi:hypothetical protein